MATATLHPSHPIAYPASPERASIALAVREAGPGGPPKPRLLDRVRAATRARHYSRRTEKAYVAWIRRFILFHDKRHPLDMGGPEVAKFLTSLAVDGNVAASTQNQALSALLFLYREVLEQELPWLDDVVRAKRPAHLPVVLTRDEVRAVIRELGGVQRLMAILLYGAGLRLLEAARLRVKDVDFARHQIIGGPDRRPQRGRSDTLVCLSNPAQHRESTPTACHTMAISRPGRDPQGGYAARRAWSVALHGFKILIVRQTARGNLPHAT